MLCILGERGSGCGGVLAVCRVGGCICGVYRESAWCVGKMKLSQIVRMKLIVIILVSLVVNVVYACILVCGWVFIC